MHSPNYTDVSAGMSSDRRVTDITLDDGTVSGQAGTAATQPPPAQSASPTSSASPPAGQTSKGFVVAPVLTVTAQPDGSIIHIVQPGEVLLNIALAYNVRLNDLYQLNFLTAQSVIYPGQKIKIKGPDPTATPTETPTPTRAPTATRRPTRTPAPSPTITPTKLVTSTSPVTPNAAATSSPDILLIAIGVMLVVGIGLVAAGSLFKRK